MVRLEQTVIFITMTEPFTNTNTTHEDLMHVVFLLGYKGGPPER